MFPSERFECPGGPYFNVGVTVIADEEFRPRRCLWSHPPARAGRSSPASTSVPLGRTIHGHSGMYWIVEREKKGAPITLTVRVDGDTVGTAVHRDGDGWAGFSFDLGAHAGASAADVEFAVSSRTTSTATSASRRTRDEARSAPSSTTPHRPPRRPRDPAAYVAWLLCTVKDLGYARDEGFYFQAASSYGRWFEQLLAAPGAALDRRAGRRRLGVNHEHPALVKSLFAISNLFLQKRHHLFAMEGTSYRFPAMVLAGVAVGLVYLWGAQARGRVAGVAAAIALATMPRFFFHAHLACFDVPIVTMWTLAAYLFWRTLRDGGVILPILTGVAFGLALDTKHNSWFLPFACAAQLVALEVWARALVAHAPAPPSRSRPRPASRASAGSRRSGRWRSSGRRCSARCGRGSGTTRCEAARLRPLPPEPRVLQHGVPRGELLDPANAEGIRVADDARHGAHRDARTVRRRRGDTRPCVDRIVRPTDSPRRSTGWGPTSSGCSASSPTTPSGSGRARRSSAAPSTG